MDVPPKLCSQLDQAYGEMIDWIQNAGKVLKLYRCSKHGSWDMPIVVLDQSHLAGIIPAGVQTTFFALKSYPSFSSVNWRIIFLLIYHDYLQTVMMNKRESPLILGVLVIFSLVTSIIATSIPLVLKQAAYGAGSGHPLTQAAPMATYGDNVYVVW